MVQTLYLGRVPQTWLHSRRCSGNYGQRFQSEKRRALVNFRVALRRRVRCALLGATSIPPARNILPRGAFNG
jgi:hypothetical protein